MGGQTPCQGWYCDVRAVDPAPVGARDNAYRIDSPAATGSSYVRVTLSVLHTPTSAQLQSRRLPIMEISKEISRDGPGSPTLPVI